jgi:hypothetical protein
VFDGVRRVFRFWVGPGVRSIRNNIGLDEVVKSATCTAAAVTAVQGLLASMQLTTTDPALANAILKWAGAVLLILDLARRSQHGVDVRVDNRDNTLTIVPPADRPTTIATPNELPVTIIPPPQPSLG